MHARQANGELARKTLNCQMNSHENCGGYVPGGQRDRVTCLCDCHSASTAGVATTINCDVEEALTILSGKRREARQRIACLWQDIGAWEKELRMIERDIEKLGGELS